MQLKERISYGYSDTSSYDDYKKKVEELDEVTNRTSSQAVVYTVLLSAAGIAIIVICLLLAFVLARKTSREVLGTIILMMRSEDLHIVCVSPFVYWDLMWMI